MAEFRAQLYGAEMVDILASFARDPLNPPDFRRSCALDVLARGSGAVAQKTTITVHNPLAQGAVHDTVAADIDAARMVSSAHLEIMRWLGEGIPFERWPDRVRTLAYEMGQVYGVPLPDDQLDSGPAGPVDP